MDVVTKNATVTAVESEHPNGEFDIILSTADLDRDGDELHPDEWKQPLPDHITLDVDHGMSVATTVGSGKPFINDQGQVQVRGTYSSIPRAQETRTLVLEKHIRTVSVAYTETKDADGKPVRELLNGAFVAVPANTKAVVLSAKAAKVLKAADGTSDSQGDDGANPTMQDLLQAIHDAAYHLGAMCLGENEITDTGADSGANKSVNTQELNPQDYVAVSRNGLATGLKTSVPPDGSPQESTEEATAPTAVKAAEAADESAERAAASVKARAFLIKMSLERAANAE